LSPACAAYLADSTREAAIALLLDRRALPQQPAIRAIGPVPLGSREPGALAQSLAARFEDNDTSPLVIPLESCRSFVSAPLLVHERLAAGQAGRFIVPSFSPSSKACAAVEICL
jgi:hypothetical protein